MLEITISNYTGLLPPLRSDSTRFNPSERSTRLESSASLLGDRKTRFRPSEKEPPLLLWSSSLAFCKSRDETTLRSPSDQLPDNSCPRWNPSHCEGLEKIVGWTHSCCLKGSSSSVRVRYKVRPHPEKVRFTPAPQE